MVGVVAECLSTALLAESCYAHVSYMYLAEKHVGIM